MFNYQNTTLLVLTLFLFSGCASQPSDSSKLESFTNDKECEVTRIEYEFFSNPDHHWRTLLKESTKTANNILISDTFAQMCQVTKMKKLNGKSVQEVCKEMACSGTIKLMYGFFHDPGTRAIARELGDGKVEFNTAKPNSGAGAPGNIAHELTHSLGYKHFTNWAWLGKYSVPYQIGRLVQEISDEQQNN